MNDRKKTAELSSDLVAVKGSAMPAPDMQARAEPPAPAPPPAPLPVAEPAPVELAPAPVVAPAPAPAAKLVEEPEEVGDYSAPLNFKVSPSFRRDFKTYAAVHDLKLNELLKLCFNAYARPKTRKNEKHER